MFLTLCLCLPSYAPDEPTEWERLVEDSPEGTALSQILSLQADRLRARDRTKSLTPTEVAAITQTLKSPPEKLQQRTPDEQARIAETLKELEDQAPQSLNADWSEIQKTREALCDALSESERNTTGKVSDAFIRAFLLKASTLALPTKLSSDAAEDMKVRAAMTALFSRVKKRDRASQIDFLERLLSLPTDRLFDSDARAYAFVDAVEFVFGVQLEDWKARKDIMGRVLEKLPPGHQQARALAREFRREAARKYIARGGNSWFYKFRCDIFSKLRRPHLFY